MTKKIQPSNNPAVREIIRHIENCGEAMESFGARCAERTPEEKKQGKLPRIRNEFNKIINLTPSKFKPSKKSILKTPNLKIL